MAGNEISLQTVQVKLEAQFATYLKALDRAEAKTKKSMASVDRSVSTTTRRVASNSNKIGMQMQQAGYQIGDFATQVAGGQSAILAFTQQGSQLLGVFGGPWGAVMGAAGAILGAVAMQLWNTESAAATLEKSSKTLNDEIAAIRGAAIDGGEGLEDLIERYGALDAKLLDTLRIQTKLNVMQAKAGLAGSISSAADMMAGGMFSGIPTRRIASQLAPGASNVDERRDIIDDTRLAVMDAQSEDLARQLKGLEYLRDITTQAATSDGGREFLDLAEQLNEVTLKAREYQEAMKEAAAADEMLAKPIPELKKLVKSVEEVTVAKRESGEASKANAEAERAAREATKAAAAAARVAQREAVAVAREAERQQERMTASLQMVANAFIDVATGTRDWKDALGELAKQILNMPAVQSGLEDMFAQIVGSVASAAFGGVSSGTIGGSPYSVSPTGPFAGHYATGGVTQPGKTYMVGENGPEAFVPAQAGRVLSVQQSQQAAGGGGGRETVVNYSVNISGMGMSEERLTGVLAEHGRNMGRVVREQSMRGY